ncbi:MAG TPA: choice-of-anchor P family protein [Bryobacteraceae bacterium]|nr:choice-of-anchor P family protein [Bryobacteraceae bacterium]
MRFRFRGSAFGAAGQITRPFHEIIEVQAASTVPQMGGHSTGRSVDFKHRHILRFAVAHTQVTGSRYGSEEDDKATYSTRVSSVIEGLNIADVITADRVVAMLVSTYGPGFGGEPSVNLVGTHFDNLRIAGVRIEVDLCAHVFDHHSTHQSLREAYKANKSETTPEEEGGFRKLIDKLTLANHEKKNKSHFAPWITDHTPGEEGLPQSRGATALSLVRGLKPEPSGVECCGHMLRVPGFGSIRLAELEIFKHTRVLTMIQVKMGSPCAGSVCVGGAADGGDGY